MAWQLSARVEAALAALHPRPGPIPRALHGDLPLSEGFVPFCGRSIGGHLLVDRSLPSAGQIVRWGDGPFDIHVVNLAIERALKKRLDLAEAGTLGVPNEGAFRAVNAAYDSLPALAVDFYSQWALVHVYSVYWGPLLRPVANYLLNQGLRPLRGVYLANHVRGADGRPSPSTRTLIGGSFGEGENYRRTNDRERPGLAVCIAGQRAPGHETNVDEQGVKYHVLLDQEGSFHLDQRPTRSKIAAVLDSNAGGLVSTVPRERSFTQYLRTRTRDTDRIPSEEGPAPQVLVPFAGECTNGVVAARQSAHTLCIDLSQPALERGKATYRLNNFPVDVLRYTFWPKESLRALHALNATRTRFDLVILQPPTVTRIRLKGKAGQVQLSRPSSGGVLTLNASEHYPDMVAHAAPLVVPGGLLMTIAPPSVSPSLLREHVLAGFQIAADRLAVEIVERRKVAHARSLKFKGLSKKRRESRLRRASETRFELTADEKTKLVSYACVDSWGAPADFRGLYGDLFDAEEPFNSVSGLLWRREAPVWGTGDELFDEEVDQQNDANSKSLVTKKWRIKGSTVREEN